jgi:hypothetical protein
MKHRIPRRAVALTAFLSLMCPMSAYSSETAKDSAQAGVLSVALKLMPLPIAGQALTSSDVTQGTIELTEKNGTIIPKSQFVNTGKTYELNILGNSLNFSGMAGSVSASFQNGKPITIPSFRDGLVNIPLPTTPKGAILAVPIIVEAKIGYTAHYRSGSVAVGKIKGNTLFLYDDNFDGQYSKSNDMLSIDSGVVFAPFSKHIATADGLLSINTIKEDGSGLEYEYSTNETGKIDIRFLNPLAETHAVFMGPEGTTVFTSGGKAQSTLPGSYAAILPGKSEAMTVSNGKDIAKAVFGGPFTGEIPITVIPANGAKPKSLNISWPPIKNLQGKNGEYYVGYRLKGGAASISINGKQVGSATHPC